MADDIVQTVTVDASQANQAFRDLGATGAEAFAKIAQAAASGNLVGLTAMVGGQLPASFVQLAESVGSFAEAESRAIETTSALASVFGTTLSGVAGLQEAFANAGVSATGLDRLMQRMSMSIAQNWASIQQGIQTSADSQERAQTQIQQSALNTQKAHEALSEASTRAAQTAVHDAQSQVDAHLGLQRAILNQ